MNVRFYKYHGAKNSLNKNLTNPDELTTCRFLDGLDSSNPIIEISLRDEGFSGTMYVPNDWNYCYIPFIDRYYFISPNKRFKRGNIVELSCHIDVLMTFKQDILNADLIVERTSYENWKSPYLNDSGLFPTSRRSITYKKFGEPLITPTRDFVLHTSGVGTSS